MALGVLGILGAPVAMLASGPDLTTRAGRHLVAGALGITALVLVELMICLIPLRKGERWAMWAAAIPLIVLGIPILVIDASFVPARTRFATLLPQIAGDGFALMVLVYLFLLQRKRRR